MRFIVGICVVFLVFLICLIISVAEKSYDVAQEQFGPKQSLVKYEWFKDASNAIESKEQSIKVYESSIEELKKTYEGVSKKDWPRDDREALNQKEVELNGLKTAYNNLVEEYNSNSSKFNWKYANTEGNVPRTYQKK